MAILPILHYPDPILKKKSRPVGQIDSALRQLVRDMAETMYAAPGVGLAAPQVGHLIRLAVIDVNYGKEGQDLKVLINPEIASTEGERKWEEGCLSVPDYAQEITRSRKVVVRYWNLEGGEEEIVGEELLAIALQHEIDHLNGILFIDRLSRLKRDLFKRSWLKSREKAP